MATSFTADIERFNRKLQGLAKVPKQVAELVIEVIEKDIAATYAAEEDPTGRPWKRRKGKQRWPILDKTGRMKGTRRVSARDGVIIVRYDSPIARFHQSGTKHMARRPLVPTGDAVPRRWTDAVREAFRKTIEQLFG